MRSWKEENQQVESGGNGTRFPPPGQQLFVTGELKKDQL